MEIDPPHESDGSTTGSKESEMNLVSGHDSGVGLPYAPEDFPIPGDKWKWKVGKRVAISGHFMDRYLYLPDRLYNEFKSVASASSSHLKGGFNSKAAVRRFMSEVFPDIDMKAFFASFTWRIPAGKVKGDTDIVLNCTPKFDPAGCKAGNINCSSLLSTNDPDQSNIMACDVCCIEPRFCHDCCCILCSKTVDSANGVDQTFIKCQAMVKDGFICGHICHIECALRSYMAGTVGGTICLDAEYYCRRCDATTDLVPHVVNLIKSCESISYGDKMRKILNLCIIILRGSTKTNAKNLLHHVQSTLAKLKEGNTHEDLWKPEENTHEDIWKQEDISAITTGEVCQYETMDVETVTAPTQITFTNFDDQIESGKLERRVEKTLASLKKSQETEYKVAEDVLTTQKNQLLHLYEQLKTEKTKLANCSPSADPSLVHNVFKIMDQIKNEFGKITAMQGVGKGFGKTSKYVLKEHFGVQADN
ncbi:putative oberon, PHD finger domain-containing protein [Helianthus annuus]|nr:putative oberon, PHD finger domain-containing protein [Helianthus annuus]KAJ0541428.1 putative oberon, PHD finger domain-containing protein [Helianthus annuus]KAJ0706508.1 putative oberon, PHD finger domain-containing protein [Helianthus annuus]KAJ0752459.1 putative oberon, PHD finger domain-containing protein [Helianthus annuus]KAJ0887066.1 putative oberon, PHD finger domain-containing protein [Helianthus annuus]